MLWIPYFLVHSSHTLQAVVSQQGSLELATLPVHFTPHQDKSHKDSHPQGLTSGDSSLPNTTTRAIVSCSPNLWASSINGTSTELWGWMTPHGAGLEYHTAASSLCFYKRDRIKHNFRVTSEKTLNFLTSTTTAINTFFKIPRRQKGTEPDARLVWA